jgi:hypothetical protein
LPKAFGDCIEVSQAAKWNQYRAKASQGQTGYLMFFLLIVIVVINIISR